MSAADSSDNGSDATSRSRTTSRTRPTASSSTRTRPPAAFADRRIVAVGLFPGPGHVRAAFRSTLLPALVAAGAVAEGGLPPSAYRHDAWWTLDRGRAWQRTSASLCRRRHPDLCVDQRANVPGISQALDLLD
jgi:hypothetical protein